MENYTVQILKRLWQQNCPIFRRILTFLVIFLTVASAASGSFKNLISYEKNCKITFMTTVPKYTNFGGPKAIWIIWHWSPIFHWKYSNQTIYYCFWNWNFISIRPITHTWACEYSHTVLKTILEHFTRD